MSRARETAANMEAITKTTEYKAADAKTALRMVHDVAFAACTHFANDDGSSGYGPALIYDFADGSRLTDDGRGYTLSRYF